MNKIIIPNVNNNETEAQLIGWNVNDGDLVKKGDIIASFEELPMLIPRGKYTMDMYENYAKFHGRTHDYKIMYNDVKKVF